MVTLQSFGRGYIKGKDGQGGLQVNVAVKADFSNLTASPSPFYMFLLAKLNTVSGNVTTRARAPPTGFLMLQAGGWITGFSLTVVPSSKATASNDFFSKVSNRSCKSSCVTLTISFSVMLLIFAALHLPYVLCGCRVRM